MDYSHEAQASHYAAPPAYYTPSTSAAAVIGPIPNPNPNPNPSYNQVQDQVPVSVSQGVDVSLTLPAGYTVSQYQADPYASSMPVGLAAAYLGPMPTVDPFFPVKEMKSNHVVTAQDLESKKQKLIDTGADANSVHTCTICNVVCNSDKVFASHIASKKHIFGEDKAQASKIHCCHVAFLTRIMAPGRSTEKRKSNLSTIHEDYISLLPDALLITIISLLPTKDARRTTILSERWHPLWASTPLNLIDVELCDSRTMCRYFNIFLCTYDRMWGVTKILESHPGPVNRFCLLHGDLNFVDPFLNNWLDTVTKKGVKELELRMCHDTHPVPTYILQCRSLKLLTLNNTRFPDLSVDSPTFSGLLELTLSVVIITDSDLEKLVMGCHALRSLSIFTSLPDLGKFGGKQRFHLRSRSLRSSTIVSGTVTELFIDAPNLERCLIEPQFALGVSVKILSAPQLKLVGYLDIDFLSKLGNNLRQGIQQSFGSTVHTLRTLGVAVAIDGYIHASSILRLLQCFRFGDTFHLQLLPPKVPVLSFEFWENVQCLEHHLKRVIFHQYKEQKGESDFARYLLSNGKVLKEMKFLVPKGSNRSWANMENKLLGSKMAAPFGTRIIWQEFEDREGVFYFDINASNWSRVDPLMDMK